MKKHTAFTVDEIKQKMATYCVYQDRCHQEVVRQLNKYGLISEAYDDILLFLLQHNFLNEERFALNFVNGKFVNKQWGKERIYQELKRRDINERLIKNALDTIDSQAYQAAIQSWIDKKSVSLLGNTPFQRKQKLYQFLRYKGFEHDFIQPLI